MAGTYSKYNSTNYYSLSSLISLSQSATQSYSFKNDYVYSNLIDNESRSLQPKYIRDSILSLWDLPSFKETIATPSNIRYIGIDSGNTSDRDIKQKIFFGKRSYKNYDILNNLLTSDTDIFFYNTKLDSDSQNDTKISILSGANPNIYSPYISSNYVIGKTASLYLNIVNQDDIHILSRSYNISGVKMTDNNLGSTVSINNVIFPPYSTNLSSNIDGKYLLVNNGLMTWTNSLFNNTITSGYIPVGENNKELNIYGSKTTINGYDLDFTDLRMTPYDLGGIIPGSTFSKDSLSEVLTRIIYNNTPPKCSLTMLNSIYQEVGTSPEIILQYKVQKFSNPLKPTRLINMIPSQLAPISDTESIIIEGISEGVFITPIIATQTNFTIKVEDINGGSVSVTKSIKGVYPYFYGFSTYSVPDIFELEKLNKIVDEKSDKTIDFIGNGNLFFIYDKNYGPLTSIISNSVNITASFSYMTATISSPNGFWDLKEFYIYRRNGVDIYAPSENYTFKY
jgi:hypothetical protein